MKSILLAIVIPAVYATDLYCVPKVTEEDKPTPECINRRTPFVKPTCYSDALAAEKKWTNATNETRANWAITKEWCEEKPGQVWNWGTNHTGYSRSDPMGKENLMCVAKEGVPGAPHYKLPMCKMYNENSCCAPIHDHETQWSYETLIDVADRCLQYVNEEHFALREFFCITCDPDQNSYLSETLDDDAYPKGEGAVQGEIRICHAFAMRMWQDGAKEGKEYDMCGFSIFTKDDDIIPFGDVDPASGDDPILPSKFWAEEPNKQVISKEGFANLAGGRQGVELGRAYESFMNSIKPGMLDNFEFRVVPDTIKDPKGNVVANTCFKGAGAAALLPRLIIAVLSVSCVVWIGQ